MRIPTDARVSNLRCPYGWSSSGGWDESRTPTSATMFDAVSVSEWKPSERTLTAEVATPKTILDTATTRFRMRTRARTAEMLRERV